MAAEIPRSHSSFGLSALRYAAIYVRAGPRRGDVKRQKRKKSNSRYSRSHKLCQPGHRCSTGSTAGQCSGHDMSNSVLTFVIVGHDDHPIFESDLAPKPDGRETQGVYLHQFVLHAALDAVNEQLWTTTSMHLGTVDKFNNLMVAAYATAAHVKFLLLHDGKNEENIRLFFKDVYDIYVRVCMNPFFTTVGRIQSPGFGQKVRILAKTHFRT